MEHVRLHTPSGERGAGVCVEGAPDEDESAPTLALPLCWSGPDRAGFERSSPQCLPQSCANEGRGASGLALACRTFAGPPAGRTTADLPLVRLPARSPAARPPTIANHRPPPATPPALPPTHRPTATCRSARPTTHHPTAKRPAEICTGRQVSARDAWRLLVGIAYRPLLGIMGQLSMAHQGATESVATHLPQHADGRREYRDICRV